MPRMENEGRKPGRPRTGTNPREVVGISFDRSHLERIKEAVGEAWGARTKFVVTAVEEKLERMRTKTS